MKEKKCLLSLAFPFCCFVIWQRLEAFGSLVNDLYLAGLLQMRLDFHTSRSVIKLGLYFGMTGLGLGRTLLGSSSDRQGRKPVLYYSLGVFMLGSVGSVFSTNITFFLICRLVQGLGGAGAMMLALTIPTDINALGASWPVLWL